MNALCWLLWAVTSASPLPSTLSIDVGGDPPMRWLSRVASAPDLCAPCSAGSQCESGLCAMDSNGVGLCTQPCDSKTACPQNFVCQETGQVSICAPGDATVCPNPYLAPLNTFCRVPSSNNDPNLLITRNCDVGLTCFVFSSGLGACVNACSALDANQGCKFGQRCCFGTDSGGFCLASTPTQSSGGCFMVQQVGDSCVQPDHSFCVQGSACLYAQTASAAKCYAQCSSASACPAGGTCQSFQGTQVCCDAQSFNPNDISTCAPFAAACKREVGVVCSSNADCILGLCQKNNTQSACSTACTTDADCPGPQEDVNGDGIADGGSTCQTISGDQRCWPTQGPAAVPACAVPKAASALPLKEEGCSCATTQLWPWSFVLSLGLMVRRRFKRTFE